jgi:hypothetical protein
MRNGRQFEFIAIVKALMPKEQQHHKNEQLDYKCQNRKHPKVAWLTK